MRTLEELQKLYGQFKMVSVRCTDQTELFSETITEGIGQAERAIAKFHEANIALLNLRVLKYLRLRREGNALRKSASECLLRSEQLLNRAEALQADASNLGRKITDNDNAA